MLGNHLSRISCKFSLFSPAQRWAREPCAIETLSLTPLAVRQPSQLVFFFHLSLHSVWWNLLLRKHSLSRHAKQQRAGRADWSDSIVSAQFQRHVGITNTPESTFNAQICALPASAVGVSWESEESSQLKRPHSVLNFCQNTGWESSKNQHFYVPISINFNFFFSWCLPCEHWCPQLNI